MLKVNGINSYYGSIHAIYDVSIHVKAGEIVSIIGANGAGKSTMMKSIMGFVKPKTGSIEFEGTSITGIDTSKIVSKGIVYVPEGRYIFPDMSVNDNLLMGAYSKKFTSKEMDSLFEEMYEMFPRLRERRHQFGGTLSGGEQQMLAIARGLMSKPKLLMLDEPSLGLAPIIVSEVFDTIERIRVEQNIPIILVEQNAFKALSISDRGYVLENGVVTLTGKSSDLLHDEKVKLAYLAG